MTSAGASAAAGRAPRDPVGGPAGRLERRRSGARAGTRSSAATRSRARTASSTRPSCRSATASPGVFRVDDTSRQMHLHAGRSADGVDWDDRPGADRVRRRRRARRRDPGARSSYAYDPRVTWLEDRYYVTWCNGYHGPTIGVGWTHDFETFHQLENAFLPFNRNGVLFPRRIGGSYAMLSRPSDNGHTPFGDIFYSESPDLVHWGRHRHVHGAAAAGRGSRRRSAPARRRSRPTTAGCCSTTACSRRCNGFVYSLGAALLDLDEPWRSSRAAATTCSRRKCRTSASATCPNVVFPCAALVDRDARPADAIYYGGADTVVCLAHGHLSELLASARS